MTQENTQSVTELANEHFNTPVYDTMNGVLNVLYRDEDENEVVFMSVDEEDELDRIEAEDFQPDLFQRIPDEVVADPAAYVEQVLDNSTEQPMGVVGNFMQDISLVYAKSQVEIVTKDSN